MEMKYGLLILLVISTLLSSCTEMCGNETVVESVSPNGSEKLVVFTRNCGATTGFSTHASILPANQVLPNEGGNLLVIKGEIKVRGIWQSANQLSIQGVGSGQVFKQEFAVGGVLVTYVE
jgi:hypothetical protein